MLPSLPERTLHSYINEYLKRENAELTFLGQAYLAIAENAASRSIRKRNDEILSTRNIVYRTLREFIGFSCGSYVWMPKPIRFDDADVADDRTAMYAAERHLNLLKPLYDIADIVLEQDGNPINSHDTEHVRRVLIQVDAMLQLLYKHQGKIISPLEKLEAESSAIQHDLGQPVTGRNVPHEEVGSILVPSILDVRGSETVSVLPETVARNTLLHVTKKFDYQGVKQAEHSPAYCLTVLADETDIARVRARQERLAILLAVESENLLYLN